MKKNLIIFGEDWMRLPSTSQHIAQQLAMEMNIIWVNSLGMRRPRMNYYDLTRLFKKLFQAIFSKKNVKYTAHANVTIISPCAIPLPSSKLALWLNGLIVSYQIHRQLKNTQKNNIFILTVLATSLPIIRRLGAKKSIYLCIDDFNTLSGIDHDSINKLEAQLLKEVDQVIVVSEVLYQKFNWLHPIILPQGVDFKLFTTSFNRPTDLPCSSPIVGFCGAIHEWIDIELIEKLATCLPKYLFLFIGPIFTDIRKLKKYPNIQFLGAKPYQQIPSYLQYWDVSILPFRANRAEVQACDPLKAREYLAAGKPVVSTDFPAIHALSNVITIADTADKFIEAVDQYCKGYDSIGIENRRKAVENDGWDKRAAKIAQLLIE